MPRKNQKAPQTNDNGTGQGFHSVGHFGHRSLDPFLHEKE